MNRFHGAAMACRHFVLPALLGLGACSTTITSSSNPSGAPVSDWTDYARLPVEVHGTVPGRSEAQLAALFPAYHAPQYAYLGGELPTSSSRRIVLYINSAHIPGNGDLCDGGALFQPGAQYGGSAHVIGALCEGPAVISTVTGLVRTRDTRANDLAYAFNIVRDQLYQSLFPDANDPLRYYQ